MRLTLTVRSCARASQSGPSWSLERGTATVGRGAESDWVINDTERHLSKLHCRVDSRDDGFTLTDLSSNGVFINGSGEPVGRDRTVRLQDGDRVAMGRYELEVRIEGDSLEADDPFADISPPSPPVAVEDLDVGFPSKSESMSRPIFAAPFGSSPVDPLIPEDFDPLPQTSDPPADADHVPPEQAFFRPPAARQGSIPEDWEQEVPPAAPVSPPPPRNHLIAQRQPTVAMESTLLQAFLEGAGLRSADLDPADALARMRQLGAAYREMVVGLRELLAARAAFKSEFRAERTQIGARDNNPLKFSTDPQQALKAMLEPAERGFLEAPDAIRQALTDLKLHNLALLGAFQAAMTAVIKEFDPERLKQTIEEKSSFNTVLPGSRKARYWENYEKFYSEIASDAEHEFHGQFAREFARAYAEKLRKL